MKDEKKEMETPKVLTKQISNMLWEYDGLEASTAAQVIESLIPLLSELLLLNTSESGAAFLLKLKEFQNEINDRFEIEES